MVEPDNVKDPQLGESATRSLPSWTKEALATWPQPAQPDSATQVVPRAAGKNEKMDRANVVFIVARFCLKRIGASRHGD